MRGATGETSRSPAAASPLPLVLALVLTALLAAGCGGADPEEPTPAPAVATAVAGPSAVRAAVEDGAVLLDVRTAEEHAAGHLRGAVHLDASRPDFAERLEELDRSASYVVYCASGRRAGVAVDTMRRQGFDDVVNGGGLEDLVALGLPAA